MHFTMWGVWNLWYYPSLEQTWSYYGAIGIVSANTVWVLLALYYNLNAGRCPLNAGVAFAEQNKSELELAAKDVLIVQQRSEIAELKTDIATRRQSNAVLVREHKKLTSNIAELKSEAHEKWQIWHLLKCTCPRCGEIRTDTEANDGECARCGMMADDPTYDEIKQKLSAVSRQ
jgi:chromosome segregation ATPase